MVNILGAPCQIQIINQTNNGKTYSNIAAIMNLPKGMPRPQPTQGVVNWDFEEHQIGDDAWNAMPPWVRTKIENGETYRYITTGDPGHLTDKRMEEIRETEAYKAYRAKNGDFPVVDDPDSELPF